MALIFCSTSRKLFQTSPKKNLSRLRLSDKRYISVTRPNLGILHHEWIASGKVVSENHSSDRVVVFLHGLLGNGKNLRTPAKKLTEMHPTVSALLLDLRGHGMTHVVKNASRQFSQPHSIDACANDILDTLTSLNLVGPTKSPIGIVGHSFGGRCALSYTHMLQNTVYDSSCEKTLKMVHPPKNTWLLDTVPGIAHPSVSNVVQVLNQITMPIENKKEFANHLMQTHKIDRAIASWMTTNLTKSSNHVQGFDFTFDLDVAHSILDDFPNQPFINMVKECISKKKASNIHLVIGGKNKEWTTEILGELHAIKASDELDSLQMHTLAKAGHWVHVDDLNGLMKTINAGLLK